LPREDEEELTKALLYTEDTRKKLSVAVRDIKKIPSLSLRGYLEDTA
jgi:hypothetical protein